MNIAQSCVEAPITIAGIDYAPIPFGQETRFRQARSSLPSDRQDDPDFRCHARGVAIGGIHHPGCDVEECPRCHRQLISCDCDGDEPEPPA